ncbi:MAG TPA: ABC transporter permease, partial [Chloroflexota bacterium]|nr:ABC transporter permease [Chloroflexota bacterium]
MNTEIERTDALPYGAELEEAPVEARTQWSLVWYRFRRNKSALVGAVVVAVLIFVAIFAPWLAPHDPTKIFDNGLTLEGTPVGPGKAFLLGTDALGHDQLSRIIYGARISMTIAVVANGFAMLIGVVIGGLGGYFSGVLGMVMMRITDIMMAFPILLLAIALVAVFQPSLWIVIGVIAFVYWTPVARIIHGEVLGLKRRDFVDAARAMGLGDIRIMLRHILPHVLPVIIVYGTLGIATNVLFEAALSYLGVGVQP